MALNLTGMSSSIAAAESQTSHTARLQAPPKLHPITGKPMDVVKTQRVTMPLVGKGVAITDKLGEMHERREKLEMANYQRKMVNQ